MTNNKSNKPERANNKSSEKAINAREAALRSLIRCFDNDKFSNIEVDSTIKKYSFNENDKALFSLLVYGVIERKITLDHVITQFSSRPIEKLEASVLMILRLGAYQILFCDKIPDSAACSESVELAKKTTHKGTSGFVNGILRSIARNKDNIKYPNIDSDYLKYLSVFYSCPEWLCQMWINEYGKKKCEKILDAINCKPTLTLRVNTLKTSRKDLISELPESAECDDAPYGIRLTKSIPINQIKQIDEGLCFVQDEASQLCSYALDAKPGETIIDTCSCPGGKSFGIAMDMQNKGRLMSLDLHENKLSLVKKGAEKLGITIIETGVNDGTVLNPKLINTADSVLCDVPCSGLGVIAKKPELRYKKQADIDNLPEVQYHILNTCCNYVKAGGRLVYSTCTLNPKENENIIKRFLSEHPEFKPDSSNMPEGKPYITLFPDKNGSDGFFISKFIKDQA